MYFLKYADSSPKKQQDKKMKGKHTTERLTPRWKQLVKKMKHKTRNVGRKQLLQGREILGWETMIVNTYV